MLDYNTYDKRGPVFKIIGVGGCGCNAINNMIEYGVKDVEFITADTHYTQVERSNTENKIFLDKVTRGNMAGNPLIGEVAAKESIEEIVCHLTDADMVIIVAGMGGGTGAGAAPVIAKASKDRGIFTVGVVTNPFSLEGPKQRKRAELGIEYLKGYVDALVVISNDKIADAEFKPGLMLKALKMSDDIIRQCVNVIPLMLAEDRMIGLDFDDVKSVLKDRGVAHFSSGHGFGKTKVADAINDAIENPLLETAIERAKGILINITGGYDIGMMEINEIPNEVQNRVGEDCTLIFGAAIDDAMKDEIKVDIIAAFEDDEYKMEESEKRSILEEYSNHLKHCIEIGFISEDYKEMEFDWGKNE